MAFRTSAIILMEETKSFYISSQLEHWFYGTVYMGLGQKHPHLNILYKNTPEIMG